MEIDRLSPGLPELIDMLQSSAELPHPAIRVEEFRAVMSSSSLASHTAGLLDCIMKSLSTERSIEIVHKLTFDPNTCNSIISS
jgi:hypothetical protein